MQLTGERSSVQQLGGRENKGTRSTEDVSGTHAFHRNSPSILLKQMPSEHQIKRGRRPHSRVAQLVTALRAALTQEHTAGEASGSCFLNYGLSRSEAHSGGHANSN